MRRTDRRIMCLGKLSEIFPTKWSGVIFVLYMTLFISQGLLIMNTQESKTYRYDPFLAVLVTEMIKLVACAVWYCSRNSCFALFEQTWKNLDLVWLYFIPAFLYCYYNNLSYVNLLHFDPPTYSILLQLRVVITGILFQILFKKSLTLLQWSSLVLLTIGCMIKNLDFGPVVQATTDPPTVDVKNETIFVKLDEVQSFGLNLQTSLIILQVLCSCFAGVYTEFLLKNKGVHLDIAVQNVFLYMDTIICNILILIWRSNFFIISRQSLAEVMEVKVMMVIINNAVVGIITSFFLKYLNSVLKTVASALELIFIAILTWFFFGVPITRQTILSIGIVSISIILYTRNPVKNPALSKSTKKDTEYV